MPFPNLTNKHVHDAFFSPQESLAHWRKYNTHAIPVPQSAILCYQSSLFQYIQSTEALEKVDGPVLGMYVLPATQNKLAVCANFGFGAPVATIVLEVLIALGVRQFLSIGYAGALQKDLNIGDIVVCTQSIRDEGVSHHYLAPAPYAYPSTQLTVQLKETLEALNIDYVEGTNWTIDAIFRETVEEVRHYQSEGVYTVEMEAAALCAVAQYRQVDLATAFVISDLLFEAEWNPQFDAEQARAGLVTLYRAARATLLS